MNIVYKTPKGSVDYYGESANILNYMLKIVEKIFRQNGGELLETPVFEKKEIIMGKYGAEAESKLIYEIAENGGEKLVLRYDLTIPFVRFILENGIKKCKRYSVGKVYRRDNPNISQGRFREFYQCDFDILGENNSNMMSEAVILNMVNEIMNQFSLPSYKIIINDTANLRKALELVFLEKSDDKPMERGQHLFKSICSTIDKLDKVVFNDIKDELLSKGLSIMQINKLEELLKENGIYDEGSRTRLNMLYEIAEIWGFRDKIEYNLSLARGLDYYNGIIFEVKLNSGTTSVMAGGRYDNLVPNSNLIGFSVGITRLMPFIKLNIKKERKFYLVTIGEIDKTTKLRIIKWCKENIVGDSIFQFSHDNEDKKFGKTLAEQLKKGTTDMLIVGEDELKNNQIMHKDLANNTQTLVSLTLSLT